MNTTAVLVRLIPTIALVRGSGAFNVVIANQAPKLTEDVRRAANDDRIVVTPLADALKRLSAATEFEDQQQALADVGEAADTLLGAIHAGTVEHAAIIHATTADLVERIKRNTAAMLDVYRPDAALVRSIRADASELSSLVDAEIREGERDAGDAVAAARLYDAADRIAHEAHDARQADLIAIGRHIAAIAA